MRLVQRRPLGPGPPGVRPGADRRAAGPVARDPAGPDQGGGGDGGTGRRRGRSGRCAGRDALRGARPGALGGPRPGARRRARGRRGPSDGHTHRRPGPSGPGSLPPGAVVPQRPALPGGTAPWARAGPGHRAGPASVRSRRGPGLPGLLPGGHRCRAGGAGPRHDRGMAGRGPAGGGGPARGPTRGVVADTGGRATPRWPAVRLPGGGGVQPGTGGSPGPGSRGEHLRPVQPRPVRGPGRARPVWNDRRPDSTRAVPRAPRGSGRLVPAQPADPRFRPRTAGAGCRGTHGVAAPGGRLVRGERALGGGDAVLREDRGSHGRGPHPRIVRGTDPGLRRRGDGPPGPGTAPR